MEAAGLYEHVLSLPDGFDTKLNADGAPLSGSQRDLLCLARAVAGQPRLLLIDGLLDGLSDEELETALNMVLKTDRSWSLVIATGRAYIAERCDQILSMKTPSGTSPEQALQN